MLSDFIEANSLKAEIINCSREVRTARDAASFLGVSIESIAKSVLFIDKNGNGITTIVLGNNNVSEEKVCNAVGEKEIRIASAEEVEEVTGYEAGGLPPISVYGVRTVIDKKVMDKEAVYCGGGDNKHLLRISPKEIEENAEGVVVAEISE